MNSTLIDVIVENVENNPHCFHGPTLLFRRIKGNKKNYYACSACRDRKDCNFYLLADDLGKESTIKLSNHWREEQKSVVSAINTLNPYSKYLKLIKLANVTEMKEKCVGEMSVTEGSYCYTCCCLFTKFDSGHIECKVLSSLTQYQLTHPTEILVPKTDTKTHAQYFFSRETVNDILLLLSRLNVFKVLCIGVPRIHEFILNSCKNKIESILLDLDKNYYNFYNKNEFIWFNMFNSHVFDDDQKRVLINYLSSGKTLVLLDPPFGGRVEPLARMLKGLSQYCSDKDEKYEDFIMDTLWFFPYFMEAHITRSLPRFRMFDYKVNYDNHASFTDAGSRKRKFGSPVRIFTNVPLKRLNLTGVSGYKYCTYCEYWVSKENKHCEECRRCTSKNGRTYVHCKGCNRCVKPSYEHCGKCRRCCLPNHVCGEFKPDTNCYHCHMPGHKKNACPELNRRRKGNLESGSNKNRKKKLKYK